MNKTHTVITPQHQSFLPAAGWLSKMVFLPFKRTRWISRYFVLLDSELRFYKDEHSDTPIQVLNLRQIAQAIPAPTLHHPYCFLLKPKQQQQKEHALKPWMIECKSEIDMETWICAIQSRIMKYSPASSPILPTAEFIPNRTLSNAGIDSVIMTSSKVYRVPMLPLRCTNMVRGEQGDSTKESLLSRRNKNLAPIVTQPAPCSPHQPPLPLFSSSLSTISSTSTLPSPTGAVLGSSLLISPGIIDRYSNYTNNNQTALVTQGVLGVQHQEKKQCDTISLGSSSPTYLMYKKRFHL